MDKKTTNRTPVLRVVFVLSVLLVVLAVGLVGFIYKNTLSDMETRAKCPPSVIGVNQAHYQMTTKAVVRAVPKGARVLDLWMPYPHNRAHQLISDIRVASPYPVEVKYDQDHGNAVLHARVKNPRKDFELAVTFSVIRRENMAAVFIDRNVFELQDRGDFSAWLKLDKAGAPTAPQKRLAQRLTDGQANNVDKARALYDHIAKLDKNDISNRAGGPAGLFVALARLAGIPAKQTSGYTMRGLDEGKVPGHSVWAEFFAPGYGWMPVDPASGKRFPQDMEYYFGNTDEWRVELVTGRDIKLAPPQRGPRISAWISPYAEIDGKKFDIRKRVSWKKEF